MVNRKKKTIVVFVGLLLAVGMFLIGCDVEEGCTADQKCSWGWRDYMSDYGPLSSKICNYSTCAAAEARKDKVSYSAGCTGSSCSK